MHELFEELGAFDPHWQTGYPTLREAAAAAGVSALYRDWCRGTGHHTAGCKPCVATRRTAPESHSLPYRLDNIGQALEVEEEFNDNLSELL